MILTHQPPKVVSDRSPKASPKWVSKIWRKWPVVKTAKVQKTHPTSWLHEFGWRYGQNFRPKGQQIDNLSFNPSRFRGKSGDGLQICCFSEHLTLQNCINSVCIMSSVSCQSSNFGWIKQHFCWWNYDFYWWQFNSGQLYNCPLLLNCVNVATVAENSILRWTKSFFICCHISVICWWNSQNLLKMDRPIPSFMVKFPL